MDNKPECKENRRVIGAEVLERLVARLGDPRFAGADFLWTLLLTYRYFTTGVELLTALIRSYKEQRQEEVDVSSSDDDTLFHFSGDDEGDTESVGVHPVPSGHSLSSSISGSPSQLHLPSPHHKPSKSKVKHLFASIRNRYKSANSVSTSTQESGSEMYDDTVSMTSSTSSCNSIIPGRCSTLTLRVFNILKQWVRNFPEDFKTYPELLTLTREFLGDVIANSPSHDLPLAKQLMRNPVIEKDLIASAQDIPSVCLKHEPGQEFDSLSARGLAETLTKEAHRIFCSIKASEFVRRAWKRSNKNDIAPNIVAAIDRCNWISKWVATEIVRGESVEERGELLEKFIRLATFCYEMNNFNDTLLIVYSLQSSSIKRLEKSWSLLPETVIKLFLTVEELADPAEKCLAMREALNSANPPCVPYVGAFLDMIYSHDVGLPTFTSQGLVNYSKLSKIGEIVRGLLLFQQDSYKFKEQEDIQLYLKGVQTMTDEDVYEMSTRKEPRSESASPSAQQFPGLSSS